MLSIPIQAIANQQFTITLDGNNWGFTIKTTDGATAVSLTLNGADVIENLQAAAGALIIPSEYEEAGNFFFITQTFALPIYTQFNITQSLIYVSAADLTAIRQPPAPPITAAYFNPIAALPQRFAPQGYT